ncbi:MAG: hypothetical protein QOE41_3785 [Mycobacterium sp.]|jgi:hypothetical protein|nr:hypothetical protein [Mycobacterium sp.]MDT5134474.1 hypothetical protein [Mycobacterium sp.]
MTEPISGAEVEQFVRAWFRELDLHAPIDEVIPYLADHGLEFTIPEGTRRSHAEMREQLDTWYRSFFDEIHTIKSLDIAPNGDLADVKLVVDWQARAWKPPEATSKQLHFDAYQTWVVGRATRTGKPEIRSYLVTKLEPQPGSASL